MDSLNPEYPPITVTPAVRPPRIWKFWGTLLWGLFIFAAMFAGQLGVVAWFVLRRDGPFDMAAPGHVPGAGPPASLFVLTGPPGGRPACRSGDTLFRTPLRA